MCHLFRLIKHENPNQTNPKIMNAFSLSNPVDKNLFFSNLHSLSLRFSHLLYDFYFSFRENDYLTSLQPSFFPPLLSVSLYPRTLMKSSYFSRF